MSMAAARTISARRLAEVVCPRRTTITPNMRTASPTGYATEIAAPRSLASLAWMTGRVGEPPVLLLDEVLAELDPGRRRDLLKRLGGVEQSIMTTTDLNLFEPEFVASVEKWQVVDGTIDAMTNVK